jgi:prolyl oligopeptidase
MRRLLAALAGALVFGQAAAAQPPSDDPFLWLEEIDSPRAMAWVEAQNVRTLKRLEGDRRYGEFLTEARSILTAQDRIPLPEFRAGGVDNLWQDDAHPHGLWRTTGLAAYRAAAPRWETLLDLDALSKAEQANWFSKGAACLKPAQTRCLVRLSDGGGDAVEVREFDAAAKRFVVGGFRFPEGKQDVEWLDAERLVAGREWTPGELTESGYPFVLKIVGRSGTPQEIFRGKKTDVWATPFVLRGDGGKAQGVLIQRALSFFEFEYSLYADGRLVRVPLPAKAQYQAFVDGQLVFTLQEPWRAFRNGALISHSLAALRADPTTAQPQLVFQPGPRQAIQQTKAARSTLAVELLEDVKGAIDVYDHVGGAWRVRRLDLPRDATLSLVDASGTDERLFVTAQGFLSPTSLWLADAASGRAAEVKSLPARFDASGHEVRQHWAVSSDGTRIPYFVVLPKEARLDGSLPTIMYGYGGFEVAKPPAYIPEMGRIWLQRGGAYVIANIRGGGEFGPAWHQAVLRDKRQLAFDDFAAVARDLAARKITAARRLGIYGRSNGGVLTSVSMTQHPELWNAVVIESPLIDMLRYHKLSAGASWVGEYGNPDLAEDRAFIAAYDGYRNLKPGMKLPEPYVTTNTRDDRVHPGHARKFAAKLEAQGYPYLYFENTFGGHANDADPELNARRWARHYVYLAQKLMD